MSQDANKRRDPEFTPATPQEQLPPYHVSLKELSNERHKYIVYPTFQRQEVWPITHAQAYIDSILLGDPSPAVEGYQEFSAIGETIWGIIDGHQRVTAILDFIVVTYQRPVQQRRR